MMASREQVIEEERAAERAYQAEVAKKTRYVPEAYVAPKKEDIFRMASQLRIDQGRDQVLEFIDPEHFRKAYPDVLLEREVRKTHPFKEFVVLEGKRYAYTHDGYRFEVKGDRLGSVEKV